MTERRRYQVVIAGGGPVGLGLAAALGIRGIRTALVERRREPQRIPKGQNLTQRTMEHFWFWGVAGAVRAARLLPPGFPESGIVAYGSLAGDHWYAPPQREIVNRWFFQDNERLPQYRTEEALRARIAALPAVDAWFGREVDDVADDGAAATVAISGGGGPRALEADFVVGCDGSRSLVRERIGVARSGRDYDQLMVLAVFRSRELGERLRRFPERSTYRVMDRRLGGYWQFFGRIGAEDGWFFHAPVPRGTAREGYDFRGLLHRAAGFGFACELDHVGFWELRIEVAESYRSGRIFIAGDAAHSHPPYGGFGLNNGLEDAANLGWKLAAALQGWGGEALLDSYDRERRPVMEDIVENFIAAGIESDRRFLEAHDPGRDPEAFARAWSGEHAAAAAPRTLSYVPHYAGSPVVWGAADGRSGARGGHDAAARPGHHLMPQALSSGRNVFKALGPGFTLLAFDAEDGPVRDFRDAAAGLAVPLAIVRDDRGGGRGDYRARLVLVRPDQHVAWRGDRPPRDPAALLARAAGLAPGGKAR